MTQLETSGGQSTSWRSFRAGSSQYKELEQIKKDFVSEFGSRSASTGQPGRESRAPRVSGEPDFTVDGGKEPLDVQRLVDLEIHDHPPAADQRLVLSSLTGVRSSFSWHGFPACFALLCNHGALGGRPIVYFFYSLVCCSHSFPSSPQSLTGCYFEVFSRALNSSSKFCVQGSDVAREEQPPYHHHHQGHGNLHRQ